MKYFTYGNFIKYTVGSIPPNCDINQDSQRSVILFFQNALYVRKNYCNKRVFIISWFILLRRTYWMYSIVWPVSEDNCNFDNKIIVSWEHVKVQSLNSCILPKNIAQLIKSNKNCFTLVSQARHIILKCSRPISISATEGLVFQSQPRQI